jgi:diguanylate cyclase (GGDEF)-like protein
MQLVTAFIYWIAVLIWLAVLTVVAVHYIRNPRIFGTTRLLLFVVAIDTCSNLAENIYFGLFFGGQYGLFPAALAQSLGNPSLLILPNILNVISGCLVLGLLLMRWLPQAIDERGRSDQLTADLEVLATTDGLTSLLNRRHFESLARTEWARFQRYGRPLSLMLLDIDRFKSVNDRFGHDTGDLVIKAVAHICKSTKRQPDVLARLGGEEFILLLPETDEASAEVAAERLRKSVEDHPLTLPGDTTLQVTISIGIAGAKLSMASFEVLLKRADKALYEAKRSGRNKVIRAPTILSEVKYQAAAE